MARKKKPATFIHVKFDPNAIFDYDYPEIKRQLVIKHIKQYNSSNEDIYICRYQLVSAVQINKPKKGAKR